MMKRGRGIVVAVLERVVFLFSVRVEGMVVSSLAENR
jgi:hypothetical protein